MWLVWLMDWFSINYIVICGEFVYPRLNGAGGLKAKTLRLLLWDHPSFVVTCELISIQNSQQTKIVLMYFIELKRSIFNFVIYEISMQIFDECCVKFECIQQDFVRNFDFTTELMIVFQEHAVKLCHLLVLGPARHGRWNLGFHFGDALENILHLCYKVRS